MQLALFASVLSITLVPALAQSQLGTGAIAGVVQDSSAGSVTGAEVTLTNKETGLVRKMVSGAGGQFAAPVLPTGAYKLRVTHAGFSALEQDDIVVNVGSTATVIAELKVGGIAETVTVEAAAAIDSAKTDESSLIDRKLIQDLPINGRRYYDFALLAAGVTRDARLGLLSFRGTSGSFNNYMVEGNDDNNAYFSENRGRYRTPSTLSANAVQEFQVGKGAYAAEFGRASGGSVNMVLRSGANTLHGDGFYYYRDQSFGARDPLAAIKPPERRQQLGGSISGPIRANRVFYFVNYDQQIRNFPLVIEDLNDVLNSGKPRLPANPTEAQQSAYDADLKAFTAGSDFLRSKFPDGKPGNMQSRTLGNNLVLGKLDYYINSSNTLSTFFNYLRSSGERAIQTPIVLPNVGRNGTDDVRIYAYNARLTSTFGGRRVNELRFQWSRDFEFEFADQAPPETTINVGSNPFSFGQATFLQRAALPDERRLQFVDNFSYLAGKHSFKFGGEFNRVHDIIDNPALFGAQYNYSSALAIGRDLVTPGARNYTSFLQNFGVYRFAYDTVDYAAFAQDQWKPHQRLTINYGIRWDKQALPSPTAPNPAIPETRSLPSDQRSFGPRIGVAYDPAGGGRTILRGGYGMYYGRIPNGLIANALQQTGLLDPAHSTIALNLQPGDANAPVYPSLLPSLPAGGSLSSTVTRLARDFARPRVQDFTFGIERQLLRGLVLSASYMHARGDHLLMSTDDNLPAPGFERIYQLPDGSTFTLPFSAGVTRTAAGVTQNVNAARPNPASGAINVSHSNGESWYNALLVEARHRLSHGLQFRVAFTWSKAENIAGNDNGGGTASETAFGGGTPADQFHLGTDRARSPLNQTYRLVSSAVWEPRWRGVRGFRFSGIYTAEDGRPVAAFISVPALPFLGADGAQYNGFGGLRGQGTGGDRNLAPNIPRNSLVGDANYKLDLRVAHDFRIVERLRLELLIEGFNIFNRSNYNGYGTTLYSAAAPTTSTPLATPIRLTPSDGFFAPNNDGTPPDGTNARRLQLSVRFRF
jgi:hypothetical protein